MPALRRVIRLFDTTLRDGTQGEGISISVDDKLKVAEALDELGIHYIEGGWPGSNPKDELFFQRAVKELKLQDGEARGFFQHATERPHRRHG